MEINFFNSKSGEKTCTVDFTEEEKQAFMQQHRDIVNAVVSGAPEEARRAVFMHHFPITMIMEQRLQIR